MEISCVLSTSAGLGESPVWCAAEQALYWVDIVAPSVHRLDLVTGARHDWKMPSAVGCVALADDGTLLVALKDGIHHFNPRTGQLRLLAHPEGDIPGNRYNDGKVAPDGRLFVGTMDELTLRQTSGALYRLDPDGRSERVLAGLIVSNGLAWSADGRTMFHSDSKAQKLCRYDYDTHTGAISNPHVIATPGEEDGRPDGGATDVSGLYWSAGISAGVLNAYTREGTRVQRIALPCAAPTMPCFGGADMRTLYITSARHHVSEQRLADKPLSGRIFSLRMQAPGVPIPPFPITRLTTSEQTR